MPCGSGLCGWRVYTVSAGEVAVQNRVRRHQGRPGELRILRERLPVRLFRRLDVFRRRLRVDLQRGLRGLQRVSVGLRDVDYQRRKELRRVRCRVPGRPVLQQQSLHVVPTGQDVVRLLVRRPIHRHVQLWRLQQLLSL
jgi:hypothetical protein